MSSAVDKLQRELDAAHQELETMRRALAAAEAKNAEHRLAVEAFEVTCKKIEQAHQEWISALDVVKDPIFMHDKDFRILRCNRAYQQRVDMPFEQIIGQRYYDVFPKTHAPVVMCREAKAQSIEEGEVRVDGRIYCAHSYPVTDGEGTHHHTVLTLEDITDRKQAEDDLLSSTSFTKAILDNLPIGIAVNSIEPSVSFSYMNDNFPKLYRTTREQLNVPDSFWGVVYEDPEFRKQLRKRVLEDYLSGDAERMVWNEIPVTRSGEETTYISARNVLMPDKEHVISMVWDVTGLRKAELALLESEGRFRALVESTNDWIWEVDAQGRYTYVSPRVESLLGYQPDELLGKSPFDLMPPTEAQRVGALFKELIDQRKPLVDLENTNLCKDGRLKTLETSALPFFDECGEFAGYRGIDRDVTEHKRAREMLVASKNLLQSVVENIPIRVFWKDAQLRYLGCNTAFAHDAGFSTPDELIGKNDFQMGWGEQAELYRADDQQIIDSGMPKIGYEEPQTTPDGRTIWLRTSKVPLRVAEESDSGMLGVYEDITERKHSEEGLKLFRTLLDKSSDAIEVFDPATLRFIDVNETASRALGYSREEMLSMSVLEIDPVVNEVLLKKIDEELQSHGSIVFETTHRRKDGSTFPVEVSISQVKADREYRVAVVRDITERQRTEQILKDEKAFSDALVQGLPDIFYLLDRQGSLLRCNTKLLELLDISAEDMSTVNALDYVQEEDRSRVAEKLRESFDAGSSSVEARLLLTNGVRDYLLTSTRIETHFGTNIIGVGLDISDRRQAETKLLESESRLHAIFDGVLDGIMLADMETKQLTSANPAVLDMLGYTEEEFSRLTVSDIHPEQDWPYVFEQFRMQASGEIRLATDMPVKRKDGSVFYADINTAPMHLGGKDYMVGIFHDITERKQTEAQLRASEVAYRTLAENLPGMVYRVFIREGGRMEFYNELPAQMTGYAENELTVGSVCSIEPLILDEDRPAVIDKVTKAMAKGHAFTIEYRLKHKDGGIRWMSEHGMPVNGPDGLPLYIDGLIFDITERKQADEALGRAIRALKTLSDVNQALVHAENEHDLLNTICQILVETGGYQMAWVGSAESDADKSIRPLAQFGDATNYVKRAKITWADTERGQGPTGMAIRTNAVVLNQDYQNNPKMSPWLRAAKARGYKSNIAFPLVIRDVMWGALTIYSNQSFIFVDEEVVLLEELADDLAYGIETLRTRGEHEQHSVILRRSLEQSIETIAATVESRDPYTAGHQRRVGELAVAIAREMGLSEDKIQGLHLAAIIHDLGKIHIPAEILAKPGKLSDIEFELIKTHPQAGYDILKNVEFPWPIADIVWQHHEKLDGSGYPQGLKGDQILLESKILTVADIVEAMSSHRPYRSTLGIKNALEEIARGRSVKYDPVVVDTCLMLFAEKKFKFSKR